VVTSTLVFEGNGQIGDYIGGYADWVKEKEKKAKLEGRDARPAGPARKDPATTSRAMAAMSERTGGPPVPTTKSVRKLTNREQRELELLPKQIERLETEQAELTAKLGDPAFYKNEANKFSEVKARLDALEKEHTTAFARWEELEAAKNG
jgi:ATP-binding cassette subfamily F protein uup